MAPTKRKQDDLLELLAQRLGAHDPKPSPSFSWGAIVNLGGIPLITAIIVLAGGYAVMQSTTTRNEAEIKSEKVERERVLKDEKSEREKMRDSFLATQGRLVEVLGKIDSRLSVTEKQQDLTNRQLEKINDVISTINARQPAARPAR